MRDDRRLLETIAGFAVARSTDDLIGAFARKIRACGADGFVAAQISAREHERMLLYTDRAEVFAPLDGSGDWWRDDPVLGRLAGGAMAPFPHEQAWSEPPASVRHIHESLMDHGLRQGLVVPIRQPAALGAVDVFAAPAADAGGELEAHWMDLALLSQAFHSSMVILAQEAAGRGIVRDTLPEGWPACRPVPHLSPRECDCLIACAHGLDTAAAAERLGIRQHTVRDYLRSAMIKLDARTRAQAVAIALRAGLISP